MKKNHYIFTSESVSSAHPDKLMDGCAETLLDNFLAADPNSHCAIEMMCTTGQVVVFGEVKSEAYIDIPSIVRNKIKKVGYTKPEYQFDGDSCGIITAIHEQSPDIDRGVTKDDSLNTGAGDQGIIFSYACNECENYMPFTIDIANNIVKELEIIRKETNLMPYLRPDAKSQVSIEYDENDKAVRIDSIVVSTQHDEFMINGVFSDELILNKIREDVINILIPRVKAKYSENVQKLFGDDIIYYVNPTGKFVIGGPCGDVGCVNRKTIVDNFGGHGSFGGGGILGKDATKVDKSSSFFGRFITKNCVAAGIADKMLIQTSYAIGVAEPVSVFINTYGTNHTQYSDAEIAQKLQELFDFRPGAIIRDLKLKQPMYEECAAYGCFGHKNEIVHKHFENKYGESVDMDVELFTWEKLDKVDMLKEAFGLN